MIEFFCCVSRATRKVEIERVAFPAKLQISFDWLYGVVVVAQI